MSLIKAHVKVSDGLRKEKPDIEEFMNASEKAKPADSKNDLRLISETSWMQT